MKDIHPVFTVFKNESGDIYEKYSELGREIHANGGPLDEKTRWLIKVSLSAANRHRKALETHIAQARVHGVSEEELRHALLLLITTCGFPTFMEAYETLKEST